MRGFLSAMLLFWLSLNIISCQKEFEDPNYVNVTPTNSTDTFEVLVNDATFPTYSIHAANLASTGTFTVSASNQLFTKTVSLSFPSNITAGSYILGQSASYVGRYNDNALPALVSDAGTLVILEYNSSARRIKGNFSFHAQPAIGLSPTAQLSNGYFSVNYP